jgi:hypothetical protein
MKTTNMPKARDLRAARAALRTFEVAEFREFRVLSRRVVMA